MPRAGLAFRSRATSGECHSFKVVMPVNQPSPEPEEKEQEPILPVEVEVYINPDGSVTFADLEEKAIPIARALNPAQLLPWEPPAREGAEPAGDAGEE